MPQCMHKGNSFKCSTVKGRDALSFHKSLYGSVSKQDQDCFILTYVKCTAPSRTDRRNAGPTRKLSVKFFIRLCNKKIVRVCQKAFLGITTMSKFRIKNLCKKYYETGVIPTENRGGDRKTKLYFEKKQAIIKFIKQFKVIETHYCRGSISHRQYLPSSLSINEMFRQFKNQNSDIVVKPSYFRQVFNQNFNVGFKLPSQDQCSMCIMLKEKLNMEKKQNTPNKEEINKIIIQKRIHILRSKAFFQYAKEDNPDLITFSFDCQKNMLLPKVQDQAAYYSRQIYLYNFGVVHGSSKSTLTPNNVFLYIWHENDRPKGSNEIASAIFHRLCSTNFENKKVVRFICDGCAAQNKNTILIGMCAYWLITKAPKNIKKIEVIFPVPGHSFIPPDRVFAQIEKRVKRQETIIHPRDYYKLYEEFGSVLFLGSDEVKVFDWKSAVSECLKPPGTWHFQFSKAKRFLITRSIRKQGFFIQGEAAYRCETGARKSVLKKGKTISSMQIKELSSGIGIKPEKMEDVDKLLTKHFGANWKEQNHEELTFYQKIFCSNDPNTHQEAVEEHICEKVDEITDFV